MLVKLLDRKGKTHFVNPLYVKSVTQKKPGVVELHGSFTSLNSKITLGPDETIDDLCDRISIALTSIGAQAAAAIAHEADDDAAAAASAFPGAVVASG